MAEMFHSRHIPVTILVREKYYWDNVLPMEEAKMISRHIVDHGVDLRLETELKEIHNDGQGNACAVTTNKDEKIDCGFVGLTAGVHPNVGFLKDGPLEINRGISVDEYLHTNIKDVYAAGDCVALKKPKEGRRPIEAVWYTGKMMGETVAYNICGKKIKYDPGIWFNSAKFMDIEYQVYGEVPRVNPEHLASLYWEHSDGLKSIRINYHKEDKSILGFNLMGIRYRHEVCEKWLQNKTHVEEVLTHLGLANFDPEFYKEYEADLVKKYNQETGSKLELKTKRGLKKVLAFLNK
jgi:NADPH-dependent 2,4-dienoyl-CoA reductase/sulfur reductase-like enzyme